MQQNSEECSATMIIQIQRSVLLTGNRVWEFTTILGLLFQQVSKPTILWWRKSLFFFFKWVEYLSNEMLCNDIQICFFFWCAAYLEDYSRMSLLTVHSARSCMQLMFFRDKSWLIICPISVLSYCSNNSCPFLTVSFLSTKTTILPHPGCNTNYIKHSFSSLLSFPHISVL